MPRPEAIYIPAVVRNYARREGLTVAELSVRLGHSCNWLYRIFQSDQDQISAYIKIASAAGLSIDELIFMIEQKQSRAVIEKLKEGGSTYALAKSLKVSEAFIRSLCKNTGKLNALKSYVELARAISCKVSELLTAAEVSELSA